MNDEEMTLLKILMVKLIAESGISTFLWSVSGAITIAAEDDLNKTVVIYNRHKNASNFFDNRADQIKHAVLNKKNEP